MNTPLPSPQKGFATRNDSAKKVASTRIVETLHARAPNYRTDRTSARSHRLKLSVTAASGCCRPQICRDGERISSSGRLSTMHQIAERAAVTRKREFFASSETIASRHSTDTVILASQSNLIALAVHAFICTRMVFRTGTAKQPPRACQGRHCQSPETEKSPENSRLAGGAGWIRTAGVARVFPQEKGRVCWSCFRSNPLASSRQ